MVWDVNELEYESYQFFHENIRPFPTKRNGEIDYSKTRLHDNDVDAFRHAYVSGIFAMRYGENPTKVLGWTNEFFNFGQSAECENMDFWNNYVGIKYGMKFRKCNDKDDYEPKYRRKIALLVKQALSNGELIIEPSDKRRIKDFKKLDSNKPVVVLKESKTRQNEIFFDVTSCKQMSRSQFVKLIEQGKYPGYKVSKLKGIKTPISKPDKNTGNNLD